MATSITRSLIYSIQIDGVSVPAKFRNEIPVSQFDLIGYHESGDANGAGGGSGKAHFEPLQIKIDYNPETTASLYVLMAEGGGVDSAILRGNASNGDFRLKIELQGVHIKSVHIQLEQAKPYILVELNYNRIRWYYTEDEAEGWDIGSNKRS